MANSEDAQRNKHEQGNPEASPDVEPQVPVIENHQRLARATHLLVLTETHYHDRRDSLMLYFLQNTQECPARPTRILNC